MAELVDALALGASFDEKWGFESLLAHLTNWKQYIILLNISPSGVIGSHVWLKIRYQKWCVGSSPTLGINAPLAQLAEQVAFNH